MVVKRKSKIGAQAKQAAHLMCRVSGGGPVNSVTCFEPNASRPSPDFVFSSFMDAFNASMRADRYRRIIYAQNVSKMNNLRSESRLFHYLSIQVHFFSAELELLLHLILRCVAMLESRCIENSATQLQPHIFGQRQTGRVKESGSRASREFDSDDIGAIGVRQRRGGQPVLAFAIRVFKDVWAQDDHTLHDLLQFFAGVVHSAGLDAGPFDGVLRAVLPHPTNINLLVRRRDWGRQEQVAELAFEPQYRC